MAYIYNHKYVDMFQNALYMALMLGVIAYNAYIE